MENQAFQHQQSEAARRAYMLKVAIILAFIKEVSFAHRHFSDDERFLARCEDMIESEMHDQLGACAKHLQMTYCRRVDGHLHVRHGARARMAFFFDVPVSYINDCLDYKEWEVTRQQIGLR
jgi:hypothetical protein